MDTARQLHVLLWILLLALPCTAETLTVATLNARNYNSIDRHLEGHWRPAYPKPEAEKEALRTVIQAVGAAILLIQEIGPSEYLEELRRDLKQEGLDYPYTAHLQAQDGQRCLGVLSTVPLLRVEGHREIAFNLAGERRFVRRGLLEVEVGLGDRTLTLFTAHLKSRLSDDPDDPDSVRLRTAEAEAIRRVIDSRMMGDGRLFVLAGDFNDVPGSAPYKRLTVKGGAPWAVDVRPVDGRGRAWTYLHRPTDTCERIDYILLSPALERHVVPGSARIYDGPSASAASDHRLLCITLNFEPQMPK